MQSELCSCCVWDLHSCSGKDSCTETAQCSRCKHRRVDSTVGFKAGWCTVFVCVWMLFRENGFCISALVSSSSPPSPSLSCPSIPHPLSSYYSHSALEGRQWTLNALCCLLHCLCCFSVPVPHSLPIFVFINHNGCLLRVSWWLFWSSFVPQHSFCL